MGGDMLGERIVEQTSVFLLRACGAAHRKAAQPHQMVANTRRRIWAIECFARRAQYRERQHRTSTGGGEYFEDALCSVVAGGAAAYEQPLVGVAERELTRRADFDIPSLAEQVREHLYHEPIALGRICDLL